MERETYSSELCWREFCDAHERRGRSGCFLSLFVSKAFSDRDRVELLDEVTIYR